MSHIRQFVWMVALCSLLLFSITGTTRAGGWTVVTLDQWPANVQAGKSFQVEFQVMQHGVTPLTLGPGQTTVVARHPASGETLTFTAQPAGTAGHYSVEILLHQDGKWMWEIHPGGFPPAPMPELTAAAHTEESTQGASPSPEWPLWQQVAFNLFASIDGGSMKAPERQVAPAVDQAAYGKLLFMAKGCTTCHIHAQVPTTFSVAIGPNLTHYKVIPEYVRVWLHDPSSIKPETKMPNLFLSDGEIAALISFLSGSNDD